MAPLSKEIKKFIFENCPKEWRQYVNGEVSDFYIETLYLIHKRHIETKRVNEGLRQQFFDALERNIYLSKLEKVLKDSVELNFKEVLERKIFLN
ncbi:hypothetical protein ACOKFD_16320 [Flagellimonas sp. S174]|uniref:hypothetical protein n=1 Tax=Flagellimonas sp. S174 TaxID=3410790 RepID=UPI003BF53B58